MFEFTEEEFNTICKKAMLNDELTKIFEMKIRDYSITKIAIVDGQLKKNKRIIEENKLRVLF